MSLSTKSSISQLECIFIFYNKIAVQGIRCATGPSPSTVIAVLPRRYHGALSLCRRERGISCCCLVSVSFDLLSLFVARLIVCCFSRRDRVKAHIHLGLCLFAPLLLLSMLRGRRQPGSSRSVPCDVACTCFKFLLENLLVCGGGPGTFRLLYKNGPGTSRLLYQNVVVVWRYGVFVCQREGPSRVGPYPPEPLLLSLMLNGDGHPPLSVCACPRGECLGTYVPFRVPVLFKFRFPMCDRLLVDGGAVPPSSEACNGMATPEMKRAIKILSNPVSLAPK